MDSEIINNIYTSWKMLSSLILESKEIQKKNPQANVSRTIIEFDKLITNISQINGALLAEGVKFPKSVEVLFNKVGENITRLKKLGSEKINYERMKKLTSLTIIVLWVISKSIRWEEEYLQKIWNLAMANTFMRTYLLYILAEYSLMRETSEKKNQYIAQVMMENSELKSSIILLEDENKKLQELLSSDKISNADKGWLVEEEKNLKMQSRVNFLLWVIEKKNREIEILNDTLEKKEKEVQNALNQVKNATKKTEKLSMQYQKELQRLRNELEEYRNIATAKAFKTIKDTLTFLNRELKKLKEENTKLRDYIKKNIQSR